MTTRFPPNHAPLRRAFAFALLFAAGSAGAADFYVDASAAAGGDGSQASPFATIKAAVDAANGVSGPSTIHVASGTYAIASASDFVTVSVPDLTLAAVDPANKPVVALDANLSTVQNNPVVFSVPVGSDRLTVANLQFAYSYAGDKNVAGNSFGESGKLFSFAANDCVFDGCEFVQTGTTGRNWADGGLLYSDSSEADRERKGAGLVVRNCLFDHVGASKFRPIKIAGRSQIVGNVFDACSGFFAIHKQSSGGYFVSNRIVNCTQPILSTGDNWGELPNGEIAYNVFVGSDIAFFEKTGNRGYAGQPRFHHNTVVGCRCFVQVDDVNGIEWTPGLFDNIVLASETGSVICENTASLANRKSSFKEGSFFTGNAWRAPDFVSGTALNFNGYALGLSVSGNKELASAPDFLETVDVTSTNYYRLNSYRYPWVTTTAQGATGYDATYVGAIEPIYIESTTPGDFFAIDAFAVEVDSSAPPATASFTCEFSLNGGTVTAAWDFDGDGIVDETETLAADATSASKTYSYQRAGSFTPTVHLTDSSTGNSIVSPGHLCRCKRRGWWIRNAGEPFQDHQRRHRRMQSGRNRPYLRRRRPHLFHRHGGRFGRDPLPHECHQLQRIREIRNRLDAPFRHEQPLCDYRLVGRDLHDDFGARLHLLRQRRRHNDRQRLSRLHGARHRCCCELRDGIGLHVPPVRQLHIRQQHEADLQSGGRHHIWPCGGWLPFSAE